MIPSESFNPINLIGKKAKKKNNKNYNANQQKSPLNYTKMK